MSNENELKQYGWAFSKLCSLIDLFSCKDSHFVLEQFRSKIDPSSKVLELGSGPGKHYKALKKQYDITGSEYSEAFLKTLRKKFKGETFIQLNALTMDVQEKYDVIFSNKVLQHLSTRQLIASLHKQYEALNENGLLFHTMWRGDWKDWKDKTMPFIKSIPFVKYQPEDIEKMKGNFQIKEYVEYSSMEENDSFIVVLKK